MPREACPTDDILTAFSLGDLPEAVLDSLREHQETCPRCEARARILEDRTDATIDNLRQSARGRFGLENPDDEEEQQVLSDRAPFVRPEGGTRSRPATDRGAGKRPELADYDVDAAPLGTGSMGVVYKARHRKLDRFVALKMIANQASRVAELLQIEAKAVAQLQHPNIVQIFEIGHHEGQPFLALELVEGEALDQLIAGRPQPARAAAEMVRTLALAVDYAHRHGIVHCDLKPSNILTTPEGVVKIADFGVAKWLESTEHWSDAGTLIGTPRYMSPEQARGEVETIGPATDVYSLGVILFEMLTGRPPYHSPTAAETLDLIREPAPISPREYQPKLPSDLETVVLKCLDGNPSRRYGDAKTLAEDLERFLAGSPVLARPVGRVERASRWARRHPAILSILAITALWMIILGVYSQRYHALVNRHVADLKNLALPEPRTLYGRKPILVAQGASGSIRLKAFAAAIRGMSVALEPQFGNLGHWRSESDVAVWTFQVDRPATFTLVLDYASATKGIPSPNRFQIRVGDATLRGEVVYTGAWSNYRSFNVGEVTLPAGIHRLEIRSIRPLHAALFDLRSLTLIPR